VGCVHGRHFRFRSPLLPTLNVGSSALALDWLSSRANNATLGGKCIASKPSNIGQLSGLFYLNIPKCVKHKEDPSNQLQFAGSVGRGETTTVSRPVYHSRFLYHTIRCARVCGGRGEPARSRLHADRGVGSPKCEVRIVTAYFLRGVGGTVEIRKRPAVPYALRPQNTYALTSAYALRPHLVSPHLCVRPTPSPSTPAPLLSHMF